MADAIENTPANLPPMARLMRETRFAKGEGALIEGADDKAKQDEKRLAAA